MREPRCDRRATGTGREPVMEAGIGDEEWAQRTCGFYVAAQPLLTRRKDLKNDPVSTAEEYRAGGSRQAMNSNMDPVP